MQAHITGMDKVGKLRLLEPDPKDPAALSFSLDSSCSTAKAAQQVLSCWVLYPSLFTFFSLFSEDVF